MSPMNNRLLVPRKTPGLLDLVPGAAAAYSLRSLSNSYADPVVTVRRSSDDAEEDFTAAEVSDGTLAAFAGAGDAFVKQWWDQSGNASHASQTTAGYQPKIVSSGVVVLEEGKPAIRFDGSDDFFEVPSSNSSFKALHYSKSAVVFVAAPGYAAGSNALGYIASTKPASATGVQGAGWAAIYNDVSVNTDMIDVIIDNNHATNRTVARKRVDKEFTTGSQHLYVILNDPQNATSANRIAIHRCGGADNSVELAQTYYAATDSVSGGNLFVGQSGAGTAYLNGSMQELIIYPSDITAQRALVEGLVAWGWSV